MNQSYLMNSVSVSEDEAKFFLNNKDAVDFEEFVNNCWSTVKPYILMSAGEYKPPSDDSKEEATEAANLQDEGEHEHDDESKYYYLFIFYE